MPRIVSVLAATAAGIVVAATCLYVLLVVGSRSSVAYYYGDTRPVKAGRPGHGGVRP